MFDVEAKLAWVLNANAYVAPFTSGTITEMHAKLRGTNNNCSATVDGTKPTADNGAVNFTYGNTSRKLRVAGGNLHLYSVSNACLGAIKTGDTVTMEATYNVTPATTITSP